METTEENKEAKMKEVSDRVDKVLDSVGEDLRLSQRASKRSSIYINLSLLFAVLPLLQFWLGKNTIIGPLCHIGWLITIFAWVVWSEQRARYLGRAKGTLRALDTLLDCKNCKHDHEGDQN